MHKLNKHSARELILSLLFVVSVTLLLESCMIFDRILDEGKEQQTEIRDEIYTIDSSTLLESINQDGKDAFTLKTAIPNVYPSPSVVPVQWNQSDYLTIAQVFYSVGWQDNLKDWELKNLFFGLKCSEITYGPQSAGFNYFKTEEKQDRVIRVLRHLFIAANDNIAILSEIEYFPEITKWTSIKLPPKTIPVEIAVQIADQNGGAQFRERIENNCSIYAEISYGNYGEIWVISYSGLANQKNELFRLEINANTGEIIQEK